mgnify:CR=1 FL=1
MIRKQVRFFGEQVVIACDGRCDKAWGINERPRVLLSGKDDDNIFVPDDALGIAGPPGTWEGGDGRPSSVPLTDGERMNKWCARECERGGIYKLTEEIALRDLGNPRANIPGRPSPFVRDEQGRVCLSVAKDVEFWGERERETVRVKPGVPLADVIPQ